MMWNLPNQRAALFGMDARIALVAMGVAAAAISLLSISQVSEGKIYEATRHITDLKDGIIGLYAQDPSYYSGPNTLTDPTTLSIQYNSRFASESGNDPWGNPYVIYQSIDLATILGQNVSFSLFVVVSAGPDGVLDSPIMDGPSAYQSWQAVGDDIGYKFNTYDFVAKILADNQQQLEEIAARLKMYERKIFETLRSYCDTPANQLSATCDFDGNGSYATDEEFQTNLYPKAAGETTALKYYSATTYNSGNQGSMQSLLTLLGFDGSASYLYSKDKLGRVLRYNSNTTSAQKAPFAARVWYQ